MSQQKVLAPKFELAFLLPKYWLIWLSIVLLYCISWLPYSIQLVLSIGMGKLLKVFARQRYQIAKRNLALCFPDYSQQQRDKLLNDNLNHAGMAIFESSMGWWWPTWRVAKMAECEG